MFQSRWGSRYKTGSSADGGEIVQFARQKLMHGDDLENPSSGVKLGKVYFPINVFFC
jgi:hypothetical protein